MSKRITAFALAALMFALALPASAQIQATSVEVRGTVYDAGNTSGAFHGTNATWTPQSFAGFYYDSKDNLGAENLSTNSIDVGGRKIPKNTLFYSTQAQPKMLKVVSEQFNSSGDQAAAAGLDRTGSGQAFFGGNYYIMGWQAQPYVALNSKVDKLAQLIIEQGTAASEKKTLTVGESWDVGGGWSLTANSIDAKATPRQVWLTLSKDGVKKDDKVLSSGAGGAKPIYTYTEKSIAGETDVPLFVTYVDSVFAGATSDMVQLRYTWAVSTSVTQVKSSDTYGIFKDAAIDQNAKTLSLKNTDTDVSLTQDSTQDLMGNMKFLVADNATLRFYPKVDYQITSGNVTATATAGAPGVTATGTPSNVTNVTGVPTGVAPGETTGATTVGTAAVATPTPTRGASGFEVSIAIAGLLAVAFLVLRQRK